VSKRSISIVLLISLLTLVFAASAAPAAKKQFTFGVSIGWIDNDFGLRARNGFIDTINKMGGKAIEAVALSNVQKQVSQVDNFINTKVDAIFISPYDTLALTPLIGKAQRAKIPTFVVDTMIYDPSPTCTVLSDNYRIGMDTMQYIIDKLKGKGNIVLFGAPQHEGIRNRVLGANAVLSKYPGIKVVAVHNISWAVGDPTPLDAMQNILRAHSKKGDIDAIWAPYDTAAAQICNAIEQAGRTSEMFVTGVDGDKMGIVDYINKGKVFELTAGQSPYWMAKTAVELAFKYLNGEKVPRIVTAPYALITKSSGMEPYYDQNW